LEGNEIREIDLKAVESLPKLKTLVLSKNPLSYDSVKIIGSTDFKICY